MSSISGKLDVALTETGEHRHYALVGEDRTLCGKPDITVRGESVSQHPDSPHDHPTIASCFPCSRSRRRPRR